MSSGQDHGSLRLTEGPKEGEISVTGREEITELRKSVLEISLTLPNKL